MNGRGPGVRTLFANTASALADLVLLKLGTAVAFVVLVRLLREEEIGVLGVASGYLVLLVFLDVRPVQVLLRDYPKIDREPGERDLHLTAFLVFWGLQSAVILSVSLAIQRLVLDRLGIDGLSFVFFGLTLDFILLTLQDLVKLIFYAGFQQGFATRVGLALGLARLASLSALLARPSLATYAWVLIALAIGSGIVWLLALRRRLRFSPVWSPRIRDVLRHSLADYGLWSHGQRIVTGTLVLVDTLVLSLAGAPLRDIGNYTIALRFTSVVFFQVSWQIARSLQVALAYEEDEARRVRFVNSFLKLNALLSLALLLAVLLGGEWLLRLLFGADVQADAVRFALVLGTGATIMNLGWPLISVVNTCCNLRRAFFAVFLPAWLVGLATYSVAAATWGAVGVAYGNIVVYAVLVAGLIHFLRKSYPFPVDLRWVTAEEKGALRDLLRDEL